MKNSAHLIPFMLSFAFWLLVYENKDTITFVLFLRNILILISVLLLYYTVVS